MVDFTEYVTVPGPNGGKILGRTTTGKDARVMYSWTHDPTDPSTADATNCHSLGNAADVVADSTFAASDPGVNPAGTGYPLARTEAGLSRRDNRKCRRVRPISPRLGGPGNRALDR
jgi:hypothetical protein